MLSCQVQGYTRLCAPVSGGVAELYVGDANDFVFTSGAPDSKGNPTGYDVIALRAGALTASGAFLYKIDSLDETLGVDVTQTNTDGSSSYEYTISARLAQVSQAMANFNYKLDAAALCCQLIFVWRSNDTKIFVAGEKFVDTDIIVPFKLKNDGSKFTFGKKHTDFNGQDLSVKGNYSRMPYEFTGTWTAMSGLIAP
jgi:hypothetical protein